MAGLTVAPTLSWIADLASTSGARRRGARGRRGSTSRHLWLAVAAGSVALLLVAASRRRRGAGTPVAPRDAALRDELSRDAPTGEPAAPAALPERAGSIRAAGPRLWKVPAYSFESPLLEARPAEAQPVTVQPAPVQAPAVQTRPAQPAVPATEGQPTARALAREQAAQLRRRALELVQRGHDAEAGLLDNYAVLLERSNVSGERVKAEVERLLQEAEAEFARPRHTGRFGSFRMPLPEPPIEVPQIVTLTPRVPASLEGRSLLARPTIVPLAADVRRRAGR